MSETPSTPSRLETRVLLLSELHESPLNPRKHFSTKGMEELTASIQAKGVLTPITVRPRPAGGFEIAAGHRRTRASKAAGLTHVPAIIREMDDATLLEMLVIENLQREDVHELDEGEGYRLYLKKTGADITVLAAKVGKSTSYLYQRMKLTDLCEPAKKAFLEDKITAGHAILIARLQPKDQAEALKQMNLAHSANEWYEPMSVRDLARWIEQAVHMDLHAAPWKKDDTTLLPKAGSCKACPKRSGFSPDLFPDLAKKDVCTDRQCFEAKRAAHLQRELAKAKQKGEPLLKLGDWSSRETGLLKRGDWQEAKAKSCSHVRNGLVMSGSDAGKVFAVCAERSCKTHHSGYRSRGGDEDSRRREKAEEAKRRRESDRRRQILAAIRTEVTFPELNQADLAEIAGAFYGDIWAEYRKQIAKLEGWYTDGKRNNSVCAAAEDAAKKIIPTLDLNGLFRLLVTMTLIKCVEMPSYGGSLSRQRLAEIVGKPIRPVASCLSKLKRKGLIRQVQHGVWERIS